MAVTAARSAGVTSALPAAVIAILSASEVPIAATVGDATIAAAESSLIANSTIATATALIAQSAIVAAKTTLVPKPSVAAAEAIPVAETITRDLIAPRICAAAKFLARAHALLASIIAIPLLTRPIAISDTSPV